MAQRPRLHRSPCAELGLLHDLTQARDKFDLMRFDAPSAVSAGIDRYPPTSLAELVTMFREYQAGSA